MKRHILYIGWVGFGNLGDDLCQDLFVEKITEKAQGQGIDLTVTALFPPTDFDEYQLWQRRPHLVVLGAGSLIEPLYLRPLVLAQQQGIPTAIWGSGHDGLSLEELKILQQGGRLDPFNFDPDTAYALRQCVGKVDAIGLRGPYTVGFLDTIGVTHPAIDICGDPGLLLAPSGQKPPQDLGHLLASSKPMVAVNWGTAFNRVYGGDEGAVGAQLARVLKELQDPFTFLIYPLWDKDLPACRALAKACGQVRLLDRVPTRRELVNIYQQSSLSINMKLHGNVFSAALGCPFISLAYRSKSFDFAASLDCLELVVPFDAEDLAEALTEKIVMLSQKGDDYRTKLISKGGSYRQRLDRLLERMGTLLAAGR
ncbi:MAG: polysaccharide pyruvyl transferase family protein [Limnochordia bacterium]|jgi:hypothetical protein